MKRITLLVGTTFAVLVVLGLLSGAVLSAQNPLKTGTIVKRTELSSAPGWEAILVARDLPPGAESGKHTQGGNEIVYIRSGSVVLEVEGKPALTVKAGQAFTTSAGEVHNVKNASATAPAKALAFYIAKKGAKLEDLATPVK